MHIFSATYSYGALVSKPESRATRLGMFDGTRMLASVLGAVLTPTFKINFGLSACYSLKCGLSFMSVVYVIFCVNEPTKNVQDPIGCVI